MPQRGRNTENGTRGELYEYKVLARLWQWPAMASVAMCDPVSVHSPGLPLATVTGYSGPRGAINWDQGGEQ